MKMPFQVSFGDRSYKKHLDIKKTGREAYRKLGRVYKEIYGNMGIFYAIILVSLKKRLLITSLSGFIKNTFIKKTNLYFHNPCYLATLTITNTSLRSYESHTLSFFSFTFPTQIKLGRSWPSVSLLSSLLTQLYCSCF